MVSDNKNDTKKEVILPVDLKSHKEETNYSSNFETKEVIQENNEYEEYSSSIDKQLNDNDYFASNMNMKFNNEDNKDSLTYGNLSYKESNHVDDTEDTVSQNISVANEASIDNNITPQEKRTAKFPPITIIGQYNKTYILGEYDGTLYMIDQHAAHEKIYFEKYLKEIENGDIIVQPLMVPSVLDLTMDDYSYFEENKEVFKEAGFTLEEFGGTTLALKEVPYFLGKLNPKRLFLEILDNLKNLGNGKTIEVKHNAIATKACKAAIKGNDELDMKEMVKLVEDLRYIDDPFHCPHGRPVIVKFTSTDIDKKFKRIV